MGIEPVFRATALGDKGYAERGYALPRLLNYALHALELLVERIADNLNVHLHNHLRAYALGLEAAVYLHHGELHDVGCRALNGGIYGVALGKTTHRAIRGCDVVERAPTTKHRLNIALRRSLRHSIIHIALNTWICLEVVGYKLLGIAI